MSFQEFWKAGKMVRAGGKLGLEEKVGKGEKVALEAKVGGEETELPLRI